MSILTSEPKGRVTFVAGTSIVVIERSRIYSVDIRNEHTVVCAILGGITVAVLSCERVLMAAVDQINGLVRLVSLEAGSDAFALGKTWAKEVFDSLVSEDGDVMWTHVISARSVAGWTRTPDLVPLKSRV